LKYFNALRDVSRMQQWCVFALFLFPLRPPIGYPRIMIWNSPNILTVLRLRAAPGVAVMFLYFHRPLADWFALTLFVTAAVTDWFDGYLARLWKQESKFGTMLDPIADKALLGSSLVTLSYLGEIDWWITIAILAREFAVTLYRVIVVKNKVIPASRSGKVKTILQGIAIGAVLAPFEIWVQAWSFVEQGLLFLALGSTLISGVQFFVAVSKK
jgi:CDP-diacylglycerol--glycerol-3-phosphate 3-phosphatidyltransferase